ncbi:MAG: hypothetical protein KDK91_11070 [Gammaproteobacteria bacterium]|nr:hypothetical protein [Gammaproteobacteria bacterium]
MSNDAEASNLDGLLDYSGSLGRFVVLNPSGQLFALNQVLLSRDYRKVVPRLCNADFEPARSLVLGLKPSNITLVLHPGDRAHAYFLTAIGSGGTRRAVRVFQSPREIIESSVEARRFPVLSLEELQRSIVASIRNDKLGPGGSPLPIPIRLLDLRSTVPRSWVESLADLFLINSDSDGDKADLLQDKLDELGARIKRTLVHEFFARCIWLDASYTHLGRMGGSHDGTKFSAFIGGDESLRSFARSLVRENDNYVGLSDFANVLPRLAPNMPWAAPTVHVYDEGFRQRNKLDEYYSLYRGLRALSAVGAPVLLHKEFALETAVPVVLLRPVENLAGMHLHSVRSFPLRDICWSTMS